VIIANEPLGFMRYHLCDLKFRPIVLIYHLSLMDVNNRWVSRRLQSNSDYRADVATLPRPSSRLTRFVP